jgi:3-phosphoglycerate kinase
MRENSMISYIDECEDLKGKKVILRLDLNVPIHDGVVTDTYRIDQIIETVDFLRLQGAQVIIISHHEGDVEEGKTYSSLAPLLHYLNGYFPVSFSPTYFTPEAIDILITMKDGDVVLFENIRMFPEEKSNDLEFAKKIAQMGDIFVNDAFAVSHRKHASIVGVPLYMPHYAGLLFKKEIQNLSTAFHPEHLFVFILAGAKFDTKIPLITKYLDSADHVFLGGALVHTIYKARGYNIGTSLYSEPKTDIGGIVTNPKLVTPVDVTVEAGDAVIFETPDVVSDDHCIVDAGQETIDNLKKILSGAKTIIWNGPLGNYEKGFVDKTEQLAEIIIEETKKGAVSIIGGGDTIASLQKINIENNFTFISTAGGAMLDFLANETLPGIEALQN